MFKNNKIIKVIALTATIIFSSSSSAMALSHTVEKGDTLYKISRSYGVTLDNLRSTNNKWDDLIYPGQELTIPGQTISKNEDENSKPVDENNKPVIAYSDKELDLLSRLRKSTF
jgi:N-acetylmuramoyl-L-alanine amidase